MVSASKNAIEVSVTNNTMNANVAGKTAQVHLQKSTALQQICELASFKLYNKQLSRAEIHNYGCGWVLAIPKPDAPPTKFFVPRRQSATCEILGKKGTKLSIPAEIPDLMQVFPQHVK